MFAGRYFTTLRLPANGVTSADTAECRDLVCSQRSCAREPRVTDRTTITKITVLSLYGGQIVPLEA